MLAALAWNLPPLLGGIFAVLIGGQCQISLTIAPGKAKKQPEVN
jgi:hypothetical protein